MAIQKETVRGNERIQQLMEEFLELHRRVVLKTDYIMQGVKHTPIMDQVGKWAVPDAHDMMEYDYDADSHAKEEVVGGEVSTPHSMFLRNGLALQVMFRNSSPYEVKYEGRGSYWLYRDDDPLEEVHFSPCPQWYKQTTSSGKPMASVFGLWGDRYLRLIPTNYCEYFKDGNQCRYCNITPSAEHLTEMGQERVLVKRDQDIYEAYMACARETGVEGVGLTGGGFYDRKKEADLYIRVFRALQRAMKDSGCPAPMGPALQAMEEEDQVRLKEAGCGSVSHPLEVWDPKLFEIVCPGKAKSVGRERWLESLVRAVQIFGPGRSSTLFVLGVELAQPYGFKTEDEGFQSNMEGIRWLLSHGVGFGYSVWQNRPGSAWDHVQPPRVEYILRVEQARLQLLKEFNVAPPSGKDQPYAIAAHSGDGDWPRAPKEALWPPALRENTGPDGSRRAR